ncbi:MAG: divalent metal cation transporter [Bacteroidetes bacterium]|nr:divalent metal cation transporter [Bacteroidota bacterium]
MMKNSRLSSVILWSVISAAFIGPGTVTTAASAGSGFGLQLLWAVLFATLACIVLQEVSARLTIVSGLTMGQALQKKYGDAGSKWLKYILGGPVMLGCAAYEAGNILGAVSGLNLLTKLDVRWMTIFVTTACFLVLWGDRRQTIGWLMTILVSLMGIAFFILAAGQPYTLFDYLGNSIVPTLPPGAELLTLALVGTTIVPYNVFLGSGISKGQTVYLMRVGLTISVIIGGLITAAILIAGTAVTSFSSYEELASALTKELGPLGGWSLGIGLFAAGFSSAITSPYAGSIIANHVFQWSPRNQKTTWILILLAGFVFGISGVKPIPVILAVQALNGLVLPLLTAFLIILINDPLLNPNAGRTISVYNLILLAIFGSVLLMGLNNVDKSITAWTGLAESHFNWTATITVILTAILALRLMMKR